MAKEIQKIDARLIQEGMEVILLPSSSVAEYYNGYYASKKAEVLKAKIRDNVGRWWVEVRVCGDVVQWNQAHLAVETDAKDEVKTAIGKWRQFNA